MWELPETRIQYSPGFLGESHCPVLCHKLALEVDQESPHRQQTSHNSPKENTVTATGFKDFIFGASYRPCDQELRNFKWRKNLSKVFHLLPRDSLSHDTSYRETRVNKNVLVDFYLGRKLRRD